MNQTLLRMIYVYHGRGIVLYLLITTLSAGALASLIGLERQLKGEAAGVRTHTLLAISSSFLMTISIWVIRMADGSLDILQGTFSTEIGRAKCRERV